MIYQFEHEEVTNCGDCPCCDNISGCQLGEVEESFSDIPADCPLVAISKTETTSSKTEAVEPCEVCRTVGFPDYNYCPNCGHDLRT